MQRSEDAVATIIVNWNTRDRLVRCLQTLIAETKTRQQIWIVDNASTDDSVEVVRHTFPDVRLLVSEQNLGFAAGNNLALQAADPSRFVLLLNPDTEILAGAVDRMVAYLDTHPDVGAVGVQLLNPDYSKQRSFGHFYSFGASLWRNRLVERVMQRRVGIVEDAANEPVEVDWIVGACLLVRSTALERVGLLDERFFMYGEEIDLQWRLHEAGWRIMLLPDSHIIHHGGQSARLVPREMMIQEYRSRYLLVREHTSHISSVSYVLKATLALLIWSGYWGGQWLVRRDRAARDHFSLYMSVLRQHLRPQFYR